MAGTILKISKNRSAIAEKLVFNANNGDIDLSSAKAIAQSADKDIVFNSYAPTNEEETGDLLVKKVTCEYEEVEAGKKYTFKAVEFSRKAIGGELQNVKWAYQIDDGEVVDFEKKGIPAGNTVSKIVILPDSLWDNKTVRVYAYMQSPAKFASFECKLKEITYPFYFDRYKLKGKKSNKEIADDMCYGNGIDNTSEYSLYTKKEIKDLGMLIEIQIGQKNNALWQTLYSMVKDIFSIGELEIVAVKMLNQFKSNVGGEFEDSILTKHVKEHASTKRFINSIENKIKDKLLLHKGNITCLENDIVDWVGKDYGHPRFSSMEDTFLGGLTICMNDTWAYEITIEDYSYNNGNYSLKYKIILFDHFGLDIPDVQKNYYYLAGFRAWFVLQHLRSYKPLITKIVIENEIKNND